MRGKAVPVAAVAVAAGIIPAYAGKRIKLRKRHSICGDHPRVCREKFTFFSRGISQSGSPPRMRGKDHGLQHIAPDAGITPACAGKRNSWAVHWTIQRDHPRMCGEKLVEAGRISQEEGSPPRMRGKGPAGQILVVSVGITPACAGKSANSSSSSGAPWDHPRVCGEKDCFGSAQHRKKGSPPRVRGKGHGLILHASRSAGQGRRLCPGPCPDTAGSGTPRGPSPAKRPHRSLPAATPGGCRAWQSGATAPGSR